MGDEIRFATIADYVERRLSPAHAAHVRELLAQPAIAERHTGSLAWLTAFRALSASVALPAPPPPLMERLRALMPARRLNAYRSLDVLRRTAYRLVEDQRGGALLAGARGSVAATDRQLLFELDDEVEVVVRLRQRDGGGVLVDGQVLGAEPTQAIALASGEGLWQHVADEFGEFAFAEVSASSAGSGLLLRIGTGLTSTMIDLAPYLLGTQERGG